MTEEEIMKALEACDDYYCVECPYKQFDDNVYIGRCMHNLITDTYKLLKEKEKEK